jgi:hypothetical protein
MLKSINIVFNIVIRIADIKDAKVFTKIEWIFQMLLLKRSLI